MATNLQKHKTPTYVNVVWIVGIFLTWELIAFYLAEIADDRLAGMKLPYLHSVLYTVATKGIGLLQACGTTLSRAIIGFLLGGFIGVILAIVMSLFKSVEKMVYPYLLLSQMIPILGLAPVVISIVKPGYFLGMKVPAGDITRVIIAGYQTFFPVATNMLEGLRSVQKEKKQLLYSYAASKTTQYIKLMLPFSVPYLFTGLKIAAPLAVTSSILVDTLGAAGGIGYNLTYSLYTGNYSLFWASVFCSAVIGIASYYLIVLIEKICVKWR